MNSVFPRAFGGKPKGRLGYGRMGLFVYKFSKGIVLNLNKPKNRGFSVFLFLGVFFSRWLYIFFRVVFVHFGLFMVRGKVLVLEGTDGSGKATQAALLVEKLQARGIAVELVSFPRYSSPFGQLVGRYLSGEFGSKEELVPEFVALLYALDRYHAKHDLERKLEMGITLVLDRYKASNLAHQAAKFLKKPEQEKFISWLVSAEGRLPKEDATIFLNMPEEAAQKLMVGADRKKDYRQGQTKDLHECDMEYLRRTREVYKRLAKKQKWVWVDVAFLEKREWIVRSKQEISLEIWQKLCKKIPAFKKKK